MGLGIQISEWKFKVWSDGGLQSPIWIWKPTETVAAVEEISSEPSTGRGKASFKFSTPLYTQNDLLK